MNQIINHFKRLRKAFRVYYRNNLQQHTKLGFKLVITGILLFVLIIISMFIFHSRNLPSAEDLKNASVSESTKIFDRDEQLLYEVHGNEKRTVVELSEMSDWIKKATIALEDDEFYEHPGYDIKAIARSGACLALRTVRTILFFLPDCRFSGASTITQQFVKNAYISNEVTINRKIKELILATRVEDTFTKDEILALYLNRIPYGGTLYGVEAASQAYFGIPAKDLSLMQSAIIASIPNKPSKYSPFIGNRDLLFGRAEYALNRMILVGMIDEKEKEKALSEEIVFAKYQEEMKAPHFIIYAKEKLQELLENIYSEEKATQLIETGGLSVITTLDSELQDIAEKVVVENMEKAKEEEYNAENSALVAQDPRNGEVLAMVGSKDFFSEEFDGQVNVATSLRQPGSSIKPLIYTSAFIKGYSPATVVYDVLTDFGNNYKPNNYDQKFRGPVTLRQSLAQSLNVPAVKALYLAGIPETIELGKMFGIENWTQEDADRCGLSLVLGGCEVKLIDMIELYSVFANIGEKPDQHIFLKITDRSGKLIYEYTEREREKVLDPRIAYLTHSILSDNVSRTPIFGANSPLQLSRENGAKTGTTDQYVDAWTLGYVPQLVAGVWVGNNQPSPMKLGGSAIAGPIWNQFMTQSLALEKYKEVLSFKRPEGLVSTSTSTLSGKLPSVNTPSDKIREDIFLQENVPAEVEEENRVIRATLCTSSGLLATETCPKEFQKILVYENHKTILPPDNPAYPRWQAGVDTWVIKERERKAQEGNIETSTTADGIPIQYITDISEIPTEYDFGFSAETLQNAPKLSWSDKLSDAFEYGNVEFNFSISGGADITAVDIMMDGKVIQILRSVEKNKEVSFILPLDTTNYPEGSTHALFILAHDTEGKQGFIRHSFTVKTDAFAPEIIVLSPKENTSLSPESITIEVSVTDTNTITLVEFYLDGNLVTSFKEESENKKYQYTLEESQYPLTGKHTLKIRAFDGYNNSSIQEQDLQVK